MIWGVVDICQDYRDYRDTLYTLYLHTHNQTVAYCTDITAWGHIFHRVNWHVSPCYSVQRYNSNILNRVDKTALCNNKEFCEWDISPNPTFLGSQIPKRIPILSCQLVFCKFIFRGLFWRIIPFTSHSIMYHFTALD